MLPVDIETRIANLCRLFTSRSLKESAALDHIAFLYFLQGLHLRAERLKARPDIAFNDDKDMTDEWYRLRMPPKDKSRLYIINEEILPRLKEFRDDGDSLFTAMKTFSYFNITESVTSEAVEMIHEIGEKLSEQVNGDAFELSLLRGAAFRSVIRRLNADKFAPPDATDKLLATVTQMLRPDPANQILNLCCGNGNFLAEAYLAMVDMTREQPRLQAVSLTGFDIDPLMVRVANVHLLQYNLYYTLDFPGMNHYEIRQADVLSANFEKTHGSGKYDFILAELPRRAKKNVSKLADFLKKIESPAVMFMQRIVGMLAKDGRAVVIVPESFLESLDADTHKMRKLIAERFHLDAVIRLPHYDRRDKIGSAVLIMRKTANSRRLTKRVCFYRLDGRDSFNKIISAWSNRDNLWKSWSMRLEVQHKNNPFDDRLTPANWEHRSFWFASYEQLRNENFSFLPEQYEPINNIGSVQLSYRDSINKAKQQFKGLFRTRRIIKPEQMKIKTAVTELERMALAELIEEGTLVTCAEGLNEAGYRLRSTTQQLDIDPAVFERLIGELSGEQRKLYRRFLEAQQPMAIHVSAKNEPPQTAEMQEEVKEDKIGVQRAKKTVDMLTAFGLLERIDALVGMPQPSDRSNLVPDSLPIQLYQAPRKGRTP